MSTNQIKLGKLPAKQDSRTLRYSAIIKTAAQLPPIPDTFEVETKLGQKIPTQMFANDMWGDCVIAGRANLTQRFELNEQKKIIPITTNEVLDEYWREQGYNNKCFLRRWFRIPAPDNGLVMLDSLNSWRTEGWNINGQNYKIYAFAKIDSVQEVKQAIYFLNGCYIGFGVTKTAMNQFYSGHIWDNISDNKIDGGHCVTLTAYSPTDVTCITWGKRQKMTWDFFNRYVDEMYAVVDNKNSASSVLDVAALNQYLNCIQAQ